MSIIKTQKIRASSHFSLVRVERIELSSQVWKTCILTTVLYPQIVNGVGYRDRTACPLGRNGSSTLRPYGVGYRDRTDDLLDHNQTL